MRLDVFLASRCADLSRTRIQALLRGDHVTIGGQLIRQARRAVNTGESVALHCPAPVPAAPSAEPVALDIHHEDAELIVINKPAGLVVHPAPGHRSGTLVNALIAHCGACLSGIGGVRRPGIVHRLDKGTTGLLVVAKTDRAHQALCAQFADHGRAGALRRTYRALVWGAPDVASGTIDLPLSRSSANRKKIEVARRSGGRMARTDWRVLERFDDGRDRPVAALVECRLLTGRTHQIRVHMQAAGCPVMGDETYGAGFATRINRLSEAAAEAVRALHRPALHAMELQFAHPVGGKIMRFEAALPDDMQRLAAALARPA